MEFKKVKFDNGLRLLLIPQPSSLATTVLVLVAAGSKYETKEINGLSHFLEHMVFSGTQKRPHLIDISSELDSLGSKYNAFTSHEYTGYFAKAQNKHFDHLLEIIADMYLNSRFDPEEIEKERGPIIEEINMYEDMPMRNVQDIFMKLVYGDQPAGWSIAGTKDNIRKLERDDFLKYRREHYVAEATVVLVAGGFDYKGIEDKVKNIFSGIHHGNKAPKIAVKESQKKPAYLVSHKDSDQTHLILGFRAFDIFDQRRFTLQVLATLLGGGMSSRLFQKIRTELGAAYYVTAEADLYTDHGLFAMSAGIAHDKIEIVVKTALAEFVKFKEKAVKTKELQRAKDYLIGHLFLSLESSDELAGFYGGQEILGTDISTPEILAKNIQAVTAAEIQSLADFLFQNEKLNMALIGPFKDKDFGSILKI